ncbi:MAG TPA: rhodanese-like domain-containing protein [Terriglobales bacterium]|nr:rhodanese-like domain-containing protein [Terriglobales bacterium]
MFRPISELKKVLALAMLASLTAVGAAAQAKDSAKATKKDSGKAEKMSAPKVRSEMLVSSEWLAAHLNDPDVIVVHVGGSKADYEGGHIPGARWLATDAFVRNEPPGSELPTNENIKKAFEDLGIGDTKRVILYANDWQPTAARAYFTLDYVGHGDQAALLDGGLEKWVMEKRQVSSETPSFSKAEFTLKPNPQILASREQVESLMDSATLIDARPLSRYRLGHIPGASPLFWEKNLVSDAQPMLSAPNDLRKKLEMAGVTTGKRTVTLCETGWQSSFAYFVTKYLGYDVINYDGSMSDWKAQKKPMVKGDSRR